ncbi:hypothetical protein Bca52824_054814 [Brassica carinata]|uniref:Uncharacterized protein n=1 Tax=Brassica carinata TaxID=52824 RepID=A0A8X7R6V1_BRACI|nr:hypothetical protein Bca52824_054814 [Brassica carinata]
MLTLEPFSEDQGRSVVHPRGIQPISFLAPYGFTNPLTRTHVRLLSPCFKMGRMGSHRPAYERADAKARTLFDSLFKFLFIFTSRYLFAIGLSPIFSLGRNLPPDWGCIPKQPDFVTAPRSATGSGHDGALTLFGAPFQGTWARSVAEDSAPDYNSNAEDV